MNNHTGTNYIDTQLKSIGFITHKSEMSELLHTHDWSVASLGPIDTWPQSLRTILSVIIHSKFPMLLYWGPDYVCFYNEAFRPSLATDGKHPGSLGKRGSEFWPEVWHKIEPLIARVKGGGEATWSEDQMIPIYRNGVIETVYWTYSFSPVHDESGTPGGVLVTCIESSQNVLTQEQLEEKTDELSFAIEATELATWDINPFTNKIKGNERLKKWFGLGANQEVNLEAALDVILESDRQRVIEAMQNAYEYSSGGLFDIEYTIIDPFTEQGRHVKAKGRAWFNASKVAYRFNGTLQDITSEDIIRRLLQESEHRFRVMADAAPNIIWALHPDGTIKYVNNFTLKFLGLSLEKFMADNWVPYIHPEDLELTLNKIGNAILKREIYRIEQRLLRHDGEYRWLLTQGAPSYYSNGDLYGYVGSSIDITESKHAEQTLQLYSEELTAINDDLAAANEDLSAANMDISTSRNDLEKSNSILTRVNADLDNFIYTASHDLKSPINNIEGLMKMLTRKMDKNGWQDASVEEIVNMIDSSIIRFKRTLEGLTEISRVEKQMEETKEVIDFANIIADVLLDLRIPIEEAEATVEQHLAGFPHVIFSEKNLKSIFYNLISNAIKYRDPVRRPLIHLSYKPETEYLVVSVKDNGLGFNTIDTHKVFGMFQRLHSHVEGTGVGLYIVKKMIEDAGGKITVDSKVGEGSVFYVHFKI